jgi:hypothetical protein
VGLVLTQRFQRFAALPVVARVALGPALFVVGHVAEKSVSLPDGIDPFAACDRPHQVADIFAGELISAPIPKYLLGREGFVASPVVVDAKMTVLIENVTHHMDEEEQQWFPKVRKGLGRSQLQEIGARMVELRKTAPRSPAQPSALKKVVDAVIA